MIKFLKRNYVTKSSKKRKRLEIKLELLKPPKNLPKLSKSKNLEILGSILDVTTKPTLGEEGRRKKFFNLLF